MLGQANLSNRRRLLRDDTKNCVVAALIEEYVCAITASLRNEVAEIDLMLFLQHGPLRVRKNFLQHRLCRFRSKRLPLCAQKIGCDSEHRRLPDSEMEIRRRLIARRHEKLVQSWIFLRAAGSKRLRSDGVNFRPRRITRRA